MLAVDIMQGACGCCCCAARRRRFRRWPRFRDRFLFDDPEWDYLWARARRWSLDTGRSCGDFFPTLRSGPTADPYLAGRATLLSKVKNLSAEEALFASATVCARIPVPTVTEVAPAGKVPISPAGPYVAYRFEASGFGFPRPIIGRYATAADANAAVAAFKATQPPNSLEGAAVRYQPIPQ